MKQTKAVGFSCFESFLWGGWLTLLRVFACFCKGSRFSVCFTRLLSSLSDFQPFGGQNLLSSHSEEAVTVFLQSEISQIAMITSQQLPQNLKTWKIKLKEL